MAKQPTMVSIQDDPAVSGALRFAFVPKGRGEGESLPQYIVSVQGHGDATQFQWIKPPALATTRKELEGVARQRVTARHQWLDKLKRLVETVKGWAEELDWATRVVDKKLEDTEIGDHQAPGLLLQQETVRLFLEPVARVAPGTEGVVDLYLMPYYDDIASLYFSNQRWNMHYAANHGEPEAKPLTKATLRKVFDEMKAHAQ